jgi:3-oxoacyl-[acyl-carrier protein] reductase
LFKGNITNIRAKVILVTGGNSGIGEATARRFHQLGANVAILDVSDSPETISDTFLPIKCNVGSEEDVTDAVKAILAKWGTINILVNNAGIMDKMGRSTSSLAVRL